MVDDDETDPNDTGNASITHEKSGDVTIMVRAPRSTMESRITLPLAEYQALTGLPGVAQSARVQDAVRLASSDVFDRENIEYAHDLLNELKDDDEPDQSQLVAQWFRKIRTETVLALSPVSSTQHREVGK